VAVQRKKDIIITGGENVYPIEVEQVLPGGRKSAASSSAVPPCPLVSSERNWERRDGIAPSDCSVTSCPLTILCVR
jgi:acyl-CoA synthetase (AMP-forming)/AMP-acid ligase II